MSPSKAGFLRHIRALNRWQPANFHPFCIDGKQVGYLKPDFIQALRQWPEYFDFSPQAVTLKVAEAERTAVLQKVVHQLHQQGIIANVLGEAYPVTVGSRDQVLASLDRGAAAYFGIRAYGQHLNGYVRDKGRIKMWIARRSADRIHSPNRLDNLVAGGLPKQLSLQQNLIKECAEEADIPAELATQAIPVGAVFYCRETETGLKPDTLYCYDLEMPSTFIPRNTDGEVAEFRLMDIDEVIGLVTESDEFKPNCNLVIIDFLLRHGFIDPDSPGYLDIVRGLHANQCG